MSSLKCARRIAILWLIKSLREKCEIYKRNDDRKLSTQKVVPEQMLQKFTKICFKRAFKAI